MISRHNLFAMVIVTAVLGHTLAGGWLHTGVVEAGQSRGTLAAGVRLGLAVAPGVGVHGSATRQGTLGCDQPAKLERRRARLRCGGVGRQYNEVLPGKQNIENFVIHYLIVLLLLK